MNDIFYKNRLDILVKQSKFNSDMSKIIDTIAPIICDKKITKREIDKANSALKEAFGTFFYYKNDEGKDIYSPYYSISKYDEYGFKKIQIYCADRSVTDGDNTGYIPEYIKIIYLDRNTENISVEELNKYKPDSKYCPTRAQIIASFKKFLAIEAKIKALEDKRYNLPFQYYFKN